MATTAVERRLFVGGEWIETGDRLEIRGGSAYEIPPRHDAWVVGDEPYVSLHFLGADEYAS